MTVTDGNIVIVDDNPHNLRLLAGILTTQGYRVRPAQTGARALATIARELPDLVLLDIMMPDMDGYEVCRQLKAGGAGSTVPVIFLSALDDAADKVKAFQCGGVDYICKPFQDEEVLARVGIHLALRNAQRRLEAQNSELQMKNEQLEDALARIKTLSGLIPICAHCKKVREDDGFWTQVEVYVSRRTEADFSHGICPACVRELYPEIRLGERGKGGE